MRNSGRTPPRRALTLPLAGASFDWPCFMVSVKKNDGMKDLKARVRPLPCPVPLRSFTCPDAPRGRAGSCSRLDRASGQCQRG